MIVHHIRASKNHHAEARRRFVTLGSPIVASAMLSISSVRAAISSVMAPDTFLRFGVEGVCTDLGVEGA